MLSLKCLILVYVFKSAFTFRLQILHTNDMHSRFEEISQTTGVCKPDTECYGGFARVAEFVRSRRQTTPYDTLFLNAGDNFQGSPLFAIFKTDILYQMISRMGIDAMSLGNHEFDLGPKELAGYLDRIKQPVVACNVDGSEDKDFKNAIYQKDVILTLRSNNRTVGVIGYLLPETKVLSVVGKVKITDEIECLKKGAKGLKDAGVDVVIAVGHSGWEKDLEIAREVEDVDVVIGGHTDTFVYSGTPPDIEVPVGPYPTMVKQRSGKEVPVVQAYGYTKYVGVLNLEFDETTKKLINASGNPVLMTKNFPQSKEVLDALRPYQEQIKGLGATVVGKTSVDLDGICRSKECNLGDFFTDSVAEFLESRNNSLKSKFMPIAIVNGGNIRSSAPLTSLNDGNLTYGDILTILPFPGFFHHISLNGSTLLAVLKHSYGQLNKGGFLQISNINVVYPGIKGGTVQGFVFDKNGERKPLEDNMSFDMMVSDYIYNGGDGYDFSGATLIESYPDTVLDVIKDAIQRKSPIKTENKPRIFFSDIPEVISSGISTISRPIFVFCLFFVTRF